MYYVRAAALLAVLGSTIAFTACSGGSNGSSLPAVPQPVTGPSSGPAIVPTSYMPSGTTLSLVEGPIVILEGSSGYQINGGKGIGYIDVYPNAQTKEFYGGLQPKVGEYVVLVTASSLNGQSLVPAAVSLYSSSPPSGSMTGTIMSSQPYGVAMKLDSNGTYIGVGISSATKISGSIQVGSHIDASGLGSTSTASYPSSISGGTSTPTPSPTSTPSGGVPAHVLTEDYLGGLFGQFKGTPSQAAPYLSWAQTDSTDAGGIKAAGIHTQIYVDPNRVGPTDPLYGGSVESDFAHTCSNSRITIGGPQYVTDLGNSGMRAHVESYIQGKVAQGPIDNIFVDNGGALSAYTMYSKLVPGLPCNYSDSQWTTNQIGAYDSFSKPIFVNGLEAFIGSNLSPVLQLLAGSNVVGGDLEHCYSDDSQPIMGSSAWPMIEDTEIIVNDENKSFECMARNLNPASQSIPARIFTLASFLMTYNPNTSILAEEFATPDGLHVFPESGLVALQPVVPEPSSSQGIGALRTSTGVYARQYNACYIRGTSEGPCVVAVSRDYGAPHNFPYSGYSRTLTISGNGVLDGGSVGTNGPPPPSVMQPFTAVIAFK